MSVDKHCIRHLNPRRTHRLPPQGNPREQQRDECYERLDLHGLFLKTMEIYYHYCIPLLRVDVEVDLEGGEEFVFEAGGGA